MNAYLAENEELVGPKGIKTVLDKLNERMIPKCVDIYVEATGFMGAADGVTMTGMDLYEQMREVSSQLSVCVPLAQALNKKRDEVDIGQVMETMEAAAAVVNVSMGTVKGVWEIMVWAEFDKGNYQMSVYRLLPVNSGLPASVVQKIPAPEALKFQETFTVDAVLKLLRGNGMADDCVKFAKELRPFLTHLPESSYTKDVASWCDIVLVQNADEQDLERIASIKNAYSKEAGDYQSRFARVMKCFDTGRLLMSRVDTELAAAKAQEGLVLILKDFCQNMPNIWPLRGLSEDPVIIVPEQVAALKSVQEDLAKLEGTATNRFLSTHQKDVDDVKGFLENVRNDFGRAYGTRALKVMSERSFAPALPMFREICSNEKGSCKLDTDRVVTWQSASAQALGEAFPDLADTIYPQFSTVEQVNTFNNGLKMLTESHRVVNVATSSLLLGVVDYCDPVMVKMVELLQDTSEAPKSLLRRGTRQVEQFELGIVDVIKNRMLHFLFHDGGSFVANFKQQAQDLWDLTPMRIQKFLACSIPGDVAIPENASEAMRVCGRVGGVRGCGG